MGALSTIAVVVTALYAPLAASDTPPAQPRITSVANSGNGCTNTAGWYGSFNDPTFTFNQFTPTLPGTDDALNCELHVQATGASPGWQVALSAVNIAGYLVLDPGTRLDYYTTVFYSDAAHVTTTVREHVSNDDTRKIDGPAVLHPSINKPVWSQCIGSDGNPGILNVNLWAVLSGDGHASFNVTSENWDFIWRRC